MAVEIWERWDSRDSDERKKGSTRQQVWMAQGSDLEDDVLGALIAGTPLDYAGLTRSAITAARIGDELWESDITYIDPDHPSAQDQPETGESLYSFDLGGETQHIRQSLKTVGNYTKLAGAKGPDFKGAIGVSNEGGKQRVEGTDLFVPTLKFQETHWLPSALVTLGWVRTLKGIAGRVNDAAWRGFNAGELLFIGAAGSRRGRGDWEIQFSFGANENLIDIPVGDVTVSSKLGWDYLWVYYQTELDNGVKLLVQQPLAAYVEELYRRANFVQIGIGT